MTGSTLTSILLVGYAISTTLAIIGELIATYRDCIRYRRNFTVGSLILVLFTGAIPVFNLFLVAKFVIYIIFPAFFTRVRRLMDITLIEVKLVKNTTPTSKDDVVNKSYLD